MTTRRTVSAEDGAAAIAMLDSEKRLAEAPAAVTDQRRCIGSATFGIEAHEAPPDEFPAQPSQKDGLGRMCKPHWNQYTSALRRAALARKATATTTEAPAGRPSNQQRRAMAQAAGKVPAADGSVTTEAPTGETPAATARRQKFEAKLAKAGVSTDEGQRILEAANGERVRARRERGPAPDGGGQSPD